jgi:hypothetical protein
VLGVRAGTLDLHGQPRTPSWTRLAATAHPGDTEIELAAEVNWRVGDELVLASSSRDMNEAEVASVLAVNGSRVTLDHPLSFQHWGEIEEYAGRHVDMRAEVCPVCLWCGCVTDGGCAAQVGCLTRNVVVQGDETSTTSLMGGTILIAASSGNNVRLSDVEFRKTGQAYRMGRYSMHWHMSASVAGNYLRNCAIHHTYNRAVTIHGIHNVLVTGNVAYNVVRAARRRETGARC